MAYKLRYSIMAILLFPLLLSFKLRAQDYDGDEGDDGTAAKSAMLLLHTERSGKIDFSLVSTVPFSSPAEVRAFFSDRWHCTIDNRSASDNGFFALLTQEQADHIQEGWKQIDATSVNGWCSHILRKDALFVSGDIDVQPLLILLRQDGIETLRLTINPPYSGARTIVAPPADKAPHPFIADASAPSRAWRYTLPVSELPEAFHVSFGYSRSDLIRLGVSTSLFLVIPILIVLIMRTAALRRGASDPAGAWFSYMRTAQLCMTGTFLLWGATDLNTRGQLVDLASFVGWDAGWRSILAQLLAATVPVWTVYLCCTALSYKVFVRVKNVSWTWTQFISRQLLQTGKMLIPLTLYFAGLFTVLHNFRAGAAFFGLGWLSTIILVLLSHKAEKSRPAAVTSGPLRDRIFALAESLGVKLRQVFVVPAAQSGVANAFATANQTVLFTDYLIEKLSQREVDAVAAHELTHLRHNHAQTIGWMIVGIILLPSIVVNYLAGPLEVFLLVAPAGMHAAISEALASGWLRAVFMMVCFWILYSIQKKFEYTADAGAVSATRDPEAMITALVKISRLNLMPLQWSRGSETMMTHPSTMRRLQRIARSCAMPEEHLSHLIAEADKAPAPAEAYVVSSGTQGMVKIARTPYRLLALIALHILPPAAIAYCLQRYFPGTGSTWWALAAGAVASIGLYHIAVTLMGWRLTLNRASETRKTLAGKTGPFTLQQGIPVGLAPAASPRFFVTGWNWDHGLLFMAAEKLVFIGDHCTLGLKRDQIRTIVLGKGAPSWNNWQRVYFSWEDRETGRSGCFNLLPLQQTRPWPVDAYNLYLQLLAWRNREGDIREAIPADDFVPPTFTAVTSMSPKEIYKPSRTLGISIVILALAAGFSMWLKLESPWYLLFVVLLIRLFESIPHWRYREQPAVYDATNAPAMAPPMAKATAVAPPPPLPAGAFAGAPPPPPPPPRPAAPQQQVESGPVLAR